MKITFLGTCGGRVAVLNQARASGGWILEMDEQKIYIDPGPGALVRANQFRVSLRKITGVIVSHAHPDHCADAEMIVVAMTDLIHKKKGVIIGNINSIKGGENHRPAFAPYYLKAVERYEILEPEKSTEIGKIKITGTPTRHGKDEEECIDFVFDGENKVGYTSDGEYFEGMENHFKNCDVMVINCMRPRKETWPTHMNTEQAAELISKVKPRVAVLKHFGMKMIRVGPEKEAAWIEKQTGIKTIAARDGMILEIENRKMEIRQAGKVDEKASLKGFFEK